ncbi:MAG: serine/threonine-protein kinase, partial [Polyangiaceae bacterium]
MDPTASPESSCPPLGKAGEGRAGPGSGVLPQPGDVIAGKYRIESVVGEGGMGVVYAAHHMVLDQRVALKLLLVDAVGGDETVERFVREAQAAARLRSEHVVRVTDAGALDHGLPFLVMEFLQGCDLAELLRLEGPLSPTDCADYMLQSLAALAQAHAAGIVHRDLKPANLFLACRDDGSNILKVLDFGISKQQSSRAQWKELTGKAVLGTPAYMSPEQLRSSKNVDARADVWSLGVVVYELLAGRLPFDGDGPGETFAAVLETTPEPLRSHRPELSAEWEGLVLRCLSRDPAMRFQNVAELAHVLIPLSSGRWAHLLPVIEKALAKPGPHPMSTTGSALVQAAVAAAITSLPPPMPATSAASAPRATLATDRTLFAEVVPVGDFAPRRRVQMAVASALGVA